VQFVIKMMECTIVLRTMGTPRNSYGVMMGKLLKKKEE